MPPCLSGPPSSPTPTLRTVTPPNVPDEPAHCQSHDESGPKAADPALRSDTPACGGPLYQGRPGRQVIPSAGLSIRTAGEEIVAAVGPEPVLKLCLPGVVRQIVKACVSRRLGSPHGVPVFGAAAALPLNVVDDLLEPPQFLEHHIFIAHGKRRVHREAQQNGRCLNYHLTSPATASQRTHDLQPSEEACLSHIPMR